MILTVIRESAQLDIEVILGRCSERQLRRRDVRIIAIPQLLQEAEAQFPGWWVRNFRAAEAPPRLDGKR